MPGHPLSIKLARIDLDWQTSEHKDVEHKVKRMSASVTVKRMSASVTMIKKTSPLSAVSDSLFRLCH